MQKTGSGFPPNWGWAEFTMSLMTERYMPDSLVMYHIDPKHPPFSFYRPPTAPAARFAGMPFSINFWFSSAKRSPILWLLFINFSVHFDTHASCFRVSQTKFFWTTSRGESAFDEKSVMQASKHSFATSKKIFMNSLCCFFTMSCSSRACSAGLRDKSIAAEKENVRIRTGYPGISAQRCSTSAVFPWRFLKIALSHPTRSVRCS